MIDFIKKMFRRPKKCGGTGMTRAIILPSEVNNESVKTVYTEGYIQQLFSNISYQLQVKSKVLLTLGESTINACGYINFSTQKEGYYTLNLDFSKYVGKEVNETDDNDICNTMYHELCHVKTRETMPSGVLERLLENRKSLAYWAYRVIDEYRAYKQANDRYPQDKSVLASSEEDVFRAIDYYMKPLKAKGYPDEAFIDAYYDLAAALVVHSILNPEFPVTDNEGYKIFVEAFIGIVMTAAPAENMTYHDYKRVGKKLRDTFKLLLKDRTPAERTYWFQNFCKNSHMIDI